MAAWPIRFSTRARPGKWLHAPNLNGEDTKRKPAMSLFSTRIRNFNFVLLFSMDTRIKPSYLITLQRGIAEQV
jgi:hypothetical protein